ncbi:MAG: hypothetical protein KAH10_05520 [Flavobacteriales bacterium]|nr:hypothetical protein [Flavobacteriales bacterium]
MKKVIFLVVLSIAMTSCGISKKDYAETVSQQEKEITALNAKNLELEEEAISKSKDIKKLKKKVSKIKVEHSKELEQLSAAIQESNPEGVYYRIQIGAIKNPVSDNEFSQSLVKAGDFNKWRVGYFKTLDEVELAKLDLKRLGVRKFWVVPMKDGEVITYDQAAMEMDLAK